MMTNKPVDNEPTPKEPAGRTQSPAPSQQGLAEKSVTEHHVPGADGPLGAEAEEDNNP